MLLKVGLSVEEMEVVIAIIQTKISTTANFKALRSACAIIFSGLCLEQNLWNIISDPASHFTADVKQISWAIENNLKLPSHIRSAVNCTMFESRDLSRAVNLVTGPEDSFCKARILYVHAIQMLPEFSPQLRCAITSTYYTQCDYL